MNSSASFTAIFLPFKFSLTIPLSSSKVKILKLLQFFNSFGRFLGIAKSKIKQTLVPISLLSKKEFSEAAATTTISKPLISCLTSSNDLDFMPSTTISDLL